MSLGLGEYGDGVSSFLDDEVAGFKLQSLSDEINRLTGHVGVESANNAYVLPGVIIEAVPMGNEGTPATLVVTMSKEIPLDKKVYDKLTGLYDVGDNNFFEFIKNDDLLFMKQNGQLWASLKYIGNNTFEGGTGFPKATFELQKDDAVKVVVVTDIPTTKTFNGTKYLKYN